MVVWKLASNVVVDIFKTASPITAMRWNVKKVRQCCCYGVAGMRRVPCSDLTHNRRCLQPGVLAVGHESGGVTLLHTSGGGKVRANASISRVVVS